MQLRELDWARSPWKPKIGAHWRLIVCQTLVSIAAAAIWNAHSPHTFPFLKLWMGFATSSLGAMIPGVYWQLRDPKRRSQTSGRFLALSFVISAVCLAVAFFLIAPDLDAQERERALVRSLTASDISELSIRIEDEPGRRIRNAASISSLTALTRSAELFYPSHEGSKFEFQIEIHCRNGAVLEYRGRVPERHTNDISLDFHGYFGWHEIIIPGGRGWLDEVAPARGNDRRGRRGGNQRRQRPISARVAAMAWRLSQHENSFFAGRESFAGG